MTAISNHWETLPHPLAEAQCLWAWPMEAHCIIHTFRPQFDHFGILPKTQSHWACVSWAQATYMLPWLKLILTFLQILFILSTKITGQVFCMCCHGTWIWMDEVSIVIKTHRWGEYSLNINWHRSREAVCSHLDFRWMQVEIYRFVLEFSSVSWRKWIWASSHNSLMVVFILNTCNSSVGEMGRYHHSLYSSESQTLIICLLSSRFLSYLLLHLYYYLFYIYSTF